MCAGGCVQEKLPGAGYGLPVSESATTLGVGWSTVMPGGAARDRRALPSTAEVASHGGMGTNDLMHASCSVFSKAAISTPRGS